MVDFALNDEERQLRDAVRSFVSKEVVPLEQEALRKEAAGDRPLEAATTRELQDKARKSGFWGVETPEEYGGMALGPVMAAVLEMEVGRTFLPFTFGGRADNILHACDNKQAKRYLEPTLEGDLSSCFALTEPDAGSDVRNIRTRATQDGDSWAISGEKTWITNGDGADFALVFAVTDPDAVTERSITCFIVDREMGWTSRPIETLGQWDAAPASLSFANVRVPSENVLGEVNNGFGLAMDWIGKGRYMIPARAVGAAERLLQMAIDYARERRSMGRPIADYQAIQWQIADSQVEIESTKWLTLHAAWRVENGMDARHATAIAKLHGALMANQVVDRVLQIHGGMGIAKELPVERWYRELRVLRIFEGSDEIQRRAIARNLIKGHVRLGGIAE